MAGSGRKALLVGPQGWEAITKGREAFSKGRE